MLSDAEHQSLRAAFTGRLLTDETDTAPFLIDWRKTWRGVALAVAQPDTIDDVAAIVRWCAANAIAIVSQGGNTGQSGGSVPEPTGRNIVLSLARLNAIRSIDPDNATITVDSGCILAAVQQVADDAGLFFPLSLGAEGSCTIGGNLATNAGGNAVLHYGNMRALCLGLEVVTASGEIWDGLRALRKDNSGYDLRDLFIGSEGTLGIITGAVLRLFPKPVGKTTALVAVPTLSHAVQLLGHLRTAASGTVTAFEIMSDACIDLVATQFDQRRPFTSRSPWYALIEVEGTDATRETVEAMLGNALETNTITDAVIATSLAQARGYWKLRESISPAQAAAGAAVKHDIAVPVSHVDAFVDAALADTALAVPGAKPVTFGHLGDGNLHFNFTLTGDAAADPAKSQTLLNRIVHDHVRAHGGTISAEHGLGVLRRDEADAHRSPVERALMRSIKDALDPRGIMNPNKVLPLR